MSVMMEVRELDVHDDPGFAAWHRVYATAERPDIERLTTYNAEVNAHMIGVNEAMGFVPGARLGDFQRKLSWPASLARRRRRMLTSPRPMTSGAP